MKSIHDKWAPVLDVDLDNCPAITDREERQEVAEMLDLLQAKFSFKSMNGQQLLKLLIPEARRLKTEPKYEFVECAYPEGHVKAGEKFDTIEIIFKANSRLKGRTALIPISPRDALDPDTIPPVRDPLDISIPEEWRTGRAITPMLPKVPEAEKTVWVMDDHSKSWHKMP